ncbi:MAG: hypothetical protein I8H66_01120 [Sphingobacteriia bacterium]|nr:hypothetical protein [Sphingobacteriia bacterium]
MALQVLAVSSDNHAALWQLECSLKKDEIFSRRSIEIMSFCTLRNALHVFNCLRPDVLLINVKWLEFSRVERVQEIIVQLTELEPAANIVVMTPNYCSHTQQYMQLSGVKGYVYLDSPFFTEREVWEHFVVSLEYAAKGESFFCCPSSQQKWQFQSCLADRPA